MTTPTAVRLSNFVEDYNCDRCGMPLDDDTAFVFGSGENGHLNLVCKNLKPCIMRQKSIHTSTGGEYK